MSRSTSVRTRSKTPKKSVRAPETPPFTTPITFGLVVKDKLCDSITLPNEVAEHLIRLGHSVLVGKSICKSPRFKKNRRLRSVPDEDLVSRSDAMLVFGGDGTILSVGRRMKDRSIPILGVNLGTLGFLAEIKTDEVYETLDVFINGKATISERAILDVRVERSSKTVYAAIAVNDAIFTKNALARMITLELTIDHMVVSSVRGDGLIISTPTGSTAYSLASGGPVLHPDMDALLVTPICPHSLSFRPLVVHGGSIIQCRVLPDASDVSLSIDGQEGFDLKPEDMIIASRFDSHKLPIVMSPKRNYFEVLREKLKYGS